MSTVRLLAINTLAINIVLHDWITLPGVTIVYLVVSISLSLSLSLGNYVSLPEYTIYTGGN